MADTKKIVMVINEKLELTETINKTIITVTKPNGQTSKIEAQIEPDKIITNINSQVSIGDRLSVPISPTETKDVFAEQPVRNPNNPNQVIIYQLINNSGPININQKKSILEAVVDDAINAIKKLIERWF